MFIFLTVTVYKLRVLSHIREYKRNCWGNIFKLYCIYVANWMYRPSWSIVAVGVKVKVCFCQDGPKTLFRRDAITQVTLALFLPEVDFHIICTARIPNFSEDQLFTSIGWVFGITNTSIAAVLSGVTDLQ